MVRRLMLGFLKIVQQHCGSPGPEGVFIGFRQKGFHELRREFVIRTTGQRNVRRNSMLEFWQRFIEKTVVDNLGRAESRQFIGQPSQRLTGDQLSRFKLAGRKIAGSQPEILVQLINGNNILLRFSSSAAGSSTVPGVMTRMTSLLTMPLASAGSSSCSQIATLNPLRISRLM